MEADLALRELRESNGKYIEVKKCLFFPLNDTLSLIKIMGFHQQYEFIYASRKYIRNELVPSRFFHQEILDYKPYTYSLEILEDWNRQKERSSKGLLQIIEKVIKEVKR